MSYETRRNRELGVIRKAHAVVRDFRHMSHVEPGWWLERLGDRINELGNELAIYERERSREEPKPA